MIKYQLISRKNPITKEYLYCAQAEAVTPVKLDEIANCQRRKGGFTILFDFKVRNMGDN